MNKISFGFILVLNFIYSVISGQTVEYSVPPSLTICNEVIMTILITNTGSSTLENSEIDINLPCGFSYKPLSVINAVQLNINDLSKPNFALNKVNIGEKYSFSIVAIISCSAVECINNLQTFSVKSTLLANNTSKEFTSFPFNVQAPNLVITKIENPYLEAEYNDVITRKVVVKNSRLGRLAELKYYESHDGNADITLENGFLINKNTNSIEYILNASDFKKVGNKDDFLDFNEEIVLTEKIKISTCSYENQFNNSTIEVNWGCNNFICQSVKAYATIKILPSNDMGPKLVIKTTYTDPDCYFPGNAIQRINIFESNHKIPLLDFVLEINQSLGNRGIKIGTFSAPFFNDIEFKGQFTNECGELMARTVVVKVPRFEATANQKSYAISWQTGFCEEVICDPLRNEWEYKFSYLKECSEFSDSKFNGKGISTDSTLSALQTFFLLEDVFVPLSDKDTTIGKYTLFSDKLIQNKGIITILFEFPSFLNLMKTDFKLGNKLPFILDTIYVNDRVQIKLQYNLPLSAKDLTMLIPFLVNCSSEVGSGPCVERQFSSCNSLCFKDSNKDFITAHTMVDFGDNCDSKGLLKSCAGSSFATFCENKPICYDTLPGYLDYKFDFFRTNYGLADKDDDGFPDVNTTVDPTGIELFEFMPGDTMKMVLDGVIRVDKPGASFSNLYFILEQSDFKSSTTINANFLENLLFGNGKAIKEVKSTIKVYDKSENIYYTFNNLKNSIDNRNFIYNLSTQKLNESNSSFPISFKYQEGDSIYMEIEKVIDMEVFRAHMDDLAYRQYLTFRYETKTILDNMVWNIDSKFSLCNCQDGIFRLAGFDVSAPTITSLIINEEDKCPGAEYSNFIFNMFVGHDLKSTNEIRAAAKPVGIKLTKLPDFEFETMTITYMEAKFNFEPVKLGSGDYFYDFSAVFPFAGKYATNGYGFSVKRRLKACINKVIPTPFNYTIYYEKNEIGNLYFPDSISGVVPNFYTLPTIALEINQKIISSFTNKVGFGMNIREKTNFSYDVKDLFIKVSATSGLKNVRIYNPMTGADYVSTNGIIYLGHLPKGQIRNLEFLADSESCGEEKIIFEYGYDCGVYDDEAKSPCFLAKDTVIVTFPGSVIDLQPTVENSEIALCTELTNKLFVFNAGLGSAFDMKVGMTLPVGMNLVSGSCKIIYPSGGTQSFSIPDPSIIGNLDYLWDLITIWPLHKSSGLKGTSSTPNNGFDIVFKTTTDCGFISGTTILYKTEAKQQCKLATNKVAKVSNSFSVNGVLPPYSISINSNFTKTQTCAKDSLKIDFTFDKPSVDEGKIYLEIPQGWALIPNSVSGNLSNVNPVLKDNKLVWEIKSVNSNIKMSLWLQKNEFNNCQPIIVKIYSTLVANAFCNASMQNCDIESITGTSTLNIPFENPAYEVSNFQVSLDPTNKANIAVTLKNTTQLFNNEAVGKVYIDRDGDGSVSIGDSLLGNILFEGFGLINKSITSNLILENANQIDFCNLLVVVRKEENCTCDDVVSTIKLAINVNFEPKIICDRDSINLGINNETNHTYQWNEASGLSCTQCPNTIFSYLNTSQNPITFTKILTATNSNGCEIKYNYQITVQSKPNVLTQNLNICKGDTLTAIATLGSSYLWEGQNIIENGKQLLKANPINSATYIVTITDLNGCSGSGAFEVVVKDKPKIEVLSDSLFCIGPEAQLNISLEPNSTFKWLNASGKLNNETILNPKILGHNDITLFLEVRNQNCKAVFEVPVKFKEFFEISGVEDSLLTCYGEKVVINLEGGLTYDVSPSNGITCINTSCSEVTVEALFGQQTYLIVAQNQEKCISEKYFTITTFKDTLRMSENLTICDGESISIFNEVISKAGTYCDTLKNGSSACVTIMCKNLSLKPSSKLNKAVNICPGDSYQFGDLVITQPGQYCKSFQAANGCDSTSCVTIGYFLNPDLSSLTIDYSVKAGDTLQLISPIGFVSYHWTPSDGLSCDDCSSPIAFPEADVSYTLEVTNSDGCLASKTIRISVIPNCVGLIPVIPNAFTPNNDGINDFYTLGDIQLCGPMIFTVYNRWGNQVYQMIDWDNQWDGYANNSGELPQGTYYISIEFVAEGVTRVGFVDLRKKQ